MTGKMTLTFQYIEETDSTNTQLKMAAERNIPEGTVLSAGRQTAGRGRSGHTWESPMGASVYTSLLLYPTQIPDDRLALLTPLAALAVCDAIDNLTGLSAQIKWVNDVLLSGKKVCGILTERIVTDEGRVAVIIGIGINVHQKEFPPEIAGMATSVDMELARREKMPDATGGTDGECRTTPRPIHRKALTEAVWQRFISYYEAFIREKNLAYVQSAYNDRLVNKDRRCRVLDPGGAYEGTALGIDDAGRLLVERTDNGAVAAVDAGEVSVRGIYGYV